MKKNNYLIYCITLAILIFGYSCNNQKSAGTLGVKDSTGLVLLSIGDTADATNDFYDNAPLYELPINPIRIEGEIEKPIDVDFSKLSLHSVIVKEAVLDSNGNRFVGSYRYDGFSLYDILNNAKLKKANYKEFERIIDMYVQIENAQGEKVFISWGELFYPNHKHEIIIATRVMRIVPSITNEHWTLPKTCKLIVCSDLLTERNILSPSKITVKSYPKSFPTKKGLKPNLSPDIKIYNEDALVETITENPKNLKEQTYNAIFYGRGKGIHSTKPFYGVMVKDVVSKYVNITKENLRKGMFVVVAKDGYRGVFTFSEVMNRNDQSELLLLCRPESKENGIFKLFPAFDFFSDRAVKGIFAVYFSANEK